MTDVPISRVQCGEDVAALRSQIARLQYDNTIMEQANREALRTIACLVHVAGGKVTIPADLIVACVATPEIRVYDNVFGDRVVTADIGGSDG